MDTYDNDDNGTHTHTAPPPTAPHFTREHTRNILSHMDLGDEET